MSSSPSTSKCNKPCEICSRNADSHNYGVFSCDACKMFFKRTMDLKLQYTCKKEKKCLEVRVSSLKYCRACRIEKCLMLGMALKPMDKGLMTIDVLKKRNLFREKTYDEKFFFEDPTLQELLDCGNKLRFYERNKSNKMSGQNWCFLGTLTSIQFLSSLDFVDSLDISDKLILIKKFGINLALLFHAFHSIEMKCDRLITPDGEDFYPRELLMIPKYSEDFLKRLRSQLIEKLIELKITKEELLLLAMIFFCNPVLQNLSDTAVDSLSAQRQVYSSALFQYCQLTHQQSAPSRFTDLLSLCHVINKNYEDVEYFNLMFQMCVPQLRLHKIVQIDCKH